MANRSFLYEERIILHHCPMCGTELVKKNRGVLIGSGAAAVLLGIGLFWFSIIWLAACGLFIGCIGVYLLMWGTTGKGYWCRTCKRVPSDMH